MDLDVVIPTYNRAALLEKALRSVLEAERPTGLRVQVYAVDNNSTDATPQVVASLAPAFDGRLHYLRETKQGRSAALNCGIRAGRSELVAMIDDDEVVDPMWIRVIAAAFTNSGLDFASGPYRPEMPIAPPAWLPQDYPSVIGVVDGGPDERDYGPDEAGMPMGGNLVVRRSVFDRVGMYNEMLGRTDHGLLSGEDAEFYQRLRRIGAHGRYLPSLIIYHHIPPARLTKRYHRSWCFWHGVSLGQLDRVQPQPVTYFAGVPRYMLGTVARTSRDALGRALRARRAPAETFSAELKVWNLAGFWFGKYLRR